MRWPVTRRVLFARASVLGLCVFVSVKVSEPRLSALSLYTILAMPIPILKTMQSDISLHTILAIGNANTNIVVLTRESSMEPELSGSRKQCNQNLAFTILAKSSCTSRYFGEVASSSSGQQAREQKRSAGRQLGGGDDHFYY